MRGQFVNQPLGGQLSSEFFEDLARSAQRSEFFVPGHGLTGIRTQSFAADAAPSPAPTFDMRITGVVFKSGTTADEIEALTSPEKPTHAKDSAFANDPIRAVGRSVVPVDGTRDWPDDGPDEVRIPLYLQCSDDIIIPFVDCQYIGYPISPFAEFDATLAASGSSYLSPYVSKYFAYASPRGVRVQDESLLSQGEHVNYDTQQVAYPVVVNQSYGQFLIQRAPSLYDDGGVNAGVNARDGDVVRCIWDGLANAFIAINPPTERIGRIVDVENVANGALIPMESGRIQAHAAISPTIVQIYDFSDGLSSPLPTNIFVPARNNWTDSGRTSAFLWHGMAFVGDWVHLSYHSGQWVIVSKAKIAERIHFELTQELTVNDSYAEAALEHHYRGFAPEVASNGSLRVYNRNAGCLFVDAVTVAPFRYKGGVGCKGTAQYDDVLDKYWIDDMDCLCDGQEEFSSASSSLSNQSSQSSISTSSSSSRSSSSPSSSAAEASCCGATTPTIGDTVTVSFTNVGACICPDGPALGTDITLTYVGTGAYVTCDGSTIPAGSMKWVFEVENGTFLLQATCDLSGIQFVLNVYCCQESGGLNWLVIWSDTAPLGDCKPEGNVLNWVSSTGIGCAGPTSTVTLHDWT